MPDFGLAFLEAAVIGSKMFQSSVIADVPGDCLMSPKELDLIDRLGRISQRINEIADVEARSTLVRSWAAQGNLIAEKERLVQRAEGILDELVREM